MAPKESIAEKVAKHNKPAAAQDPDLRYASDAERKEAESSEAKPGNHVSNQTVGNLFLFTALERALILMIVAEYDKKVKATIRNAKEIDFSTVELTTIRSRCAIITDNIGKALSESEIELLHPLRVTLGSACSLHMRWIKKEKARLEERLFDQNDLEKGMDLTQRIANIIGEQLTLFVDNEDNDEDAN